MTRAPIFILGVPRSGTTLLRTIIDSHSRIACGPETPWLGGHQPRSIMQLCQALMDEPWGYCKSFRMPPGVPLRASRAMADTLLSEYAAARGKTRWAEKTPDNLLYIPFLRQLFPEAAIVTITRDGLDVAISTARVEEHRKGVTPFNETSMSWGPAAITQNNPLTALIRWRHWNAIIAADLAATAHLGPHLALRYEDLVSRPEPTVRDLCAFLGEPFEPAMLDYASARHDFPDWEWGSADVKARPTIRSDRVGRARATFTPAELSVLDPLLPASPDTAPAPLPSAASLASVTELLSDPFTQFIDWLNGLAAPLDLEPLTGGPMNWAVPWLYHHGLARAIARTADRRGRLVDLGSARSPIPWLAAIAGCRVTLTAPHAGWVARWEELAAALRVEIEWRIGDWTTLIADASAEVITDLDLTSSTRRVATQMNDLARILAPRGVLATAINVVTPLTPDPSHAPPTADALTLAEFQGRALAHAAFEPPAALTLDDTPTPAFVKWRRDGDDRALGTVAAALLTRRS